MAYRRCPQVLPVALLVAAGLVAAACGGSNAEPFAGGSTTTSTTGSPRTTPEQTARIMTAGLLRAGDLPRTWRDSATSSASSSDQAQIALARTIPACGDFADTVAREKRLPKVSSNTFVDAAASRAARGQVSNDAVAWRSVADAKAAYGTYSAPGMKGCLGTLFRKLVVPQAAAGGIKATVSMENLPVPGVGDEAIGYQAVVSITAGAATRQIAFIIEIVRVGSYTVSYNATLYKASPTNFGKNLVGRSIARLEAAQSS